MKKESVELMECPQCGGALEYSDEQLLCYGCVSGVRSFSIENGVSQMVVGELPAQDRYIQKIYNVFSFFYDIFLPPLFAASGLREIDLRKQILAPIRVPKGGKILEVSVGTGANLPLLKERFPSAEVYGIDISHGMLERCRKNLLRKNLKTEIFHANASQLPFKKNQFDVVLHVGGINSFAEKEKALAEMFRVLKPGGKVVINDEGLSPKKKQSWLSRSYFHLIFGIFASLERGETEPPMDILPREATDVKLNYVGRDYFWLLEFGKS